MSKFDIQVNLITPHCALYDDVFKKFDFGNRVVVKDEKLGEHQYDGIVVPFPSAYGLCEIESFVGRIVGFIGGDFGEVVEQYILKRYLGEQPLGSGFVVPVENGFFKYAIVVPLFRLALGESGAFAEMDMGLIPPDYAYNATRGLLLAVLRHNASKPGVSGKIESIYFPDFHAVRLESANDPGLHSNSHQECANQIGLGIEGVLYPSRQAKSWREALALQKSLYISPGNSTQEYTQQIEDVSQIYIKDKGELDKILRDIRSEIPSLSIAGCKKIALALKNEDRPGHQSKSDICRAICNNDNGCLEIILEAVEDGHITVHNEIDKNDLEYSTVIGNGTSGTIFSGFWKNTPVAIKEFNDQFTEEEFMRELSIMGILEHKNLVKCYGGIQSKKLIILELLQTNLFDLLHSPTQLDLGMKIRIASEVAKAMDYLHGYCNLIHRDLKSLNLLLRDSKDEVQVRICDFGISRVIDTKSVMTGNVGTVSWIAPEILEHKKYSEKADVYSFGIILWELVTRNEPFANLNGFSIPIAVIKGDRPPVPRNCNKDIRKLIRSCWNAKSKKRPTFAKIADTLAKIYKSIDNNDKRQNSIDLSGISQIKGKLTNSHAVKRAARPHTIEKSDEFSTSDKVNTDSRTITDSSQSKSMEVSGADSDIKNAKPNKKYAEADKQTVTCIIPKIWSDPIAELEINVNAYFSRLNQNIDRGTLKVVRERYILFRAKSLSVDFVNSIQMNFNFQAESDSIEFSHNLLYDIGSSIGKVDASNFLQYNTDYNDKISLENAAFVFISYTGIAYVELLEDTIFSEDPLKQIVIFEFKESFEVDSYQKSNTTVSECSCVVGSGYLSGWGEVMNNSPQATAEVLCRARGDRRCLFIRTAPSELANAVTKYCRKNGIKNHGGMPKFLRNRKDTKTKTDPQEEEQEVEEEDWFQKHWKKILGKTDQFFPSQRKDSEMDILSMSDIYGRVSAELDKFFIDPRSGTVELADDKCILVRANALSIGFHSLVDGLIKSNEEKSLSFISNFLYRLGKSIGVSNHDWFVEKIELTTPADRAQALPVNLQYFGWSNMKFNTSISYGRLKKKEEGNITCSCSTSFEALSWKQENTVPSTKSCFMHCGIIAGWFERCFNIPVACVETECKALGAKRCSFIVASPSKLLRVLDEDDIKLYSFIQSKPSKSVLTDLDHRPRSLTEANSSRPNLEKDQERRKKRGRRSQKKN